MQLAYWVEVEMSHSHFAYMMYEEVMILLRNTKLCKSCRHAAAEAEPAYSYLCSPVSPFPV